jgi:hypothetical protein
MSANDGEQKSKFNFFARSLVRRSPLILNLRQLKRISK